MAVLHPRRGLAYGYRRRVKRYHTEEEGNLMQYACGEADPLFNTLEPVVNGLGMSLVELTVSRHRGTVGVRVTVYKSGALGVEDCSRVHRAILPRLELAFPGEDPFVEVSSPGINRVIKNGYEFTHYIGRGVSCYRTDISDWTGGILDRVDTTHIVLKGREGKTELPYAVIAKAKLDYSQE
jgi:ribosome maturation factor RimP